MVRQKVAKNKEAVDFVFVEVHQNGVVLSQASRPFQSLGSMTLTADPEGELTAPFYPLPSDIQLLQITKRGVELNLAPHWEGFTTSDGKLESISSDRKSAYTHIMRRGDFGSIAYNDLRIVIRIGRPNKPHRAPPKPSKEYRGGAIDLWWGREFMGLGVGIAAALVLGGGFLFGLKARPDDRPKTFIELRDEYTLPFIHPDHFVYGPESRQGSYDRRLLIQGAVQFAQDFASISLDLSPERLDYPTPLLSSAALSRAGLRAAERQKARAFAAEAQAREDKQLADRRNGLLMIPAVRGESFESGLIRLRDDFDRFYAGTDLTLETRRQTTAAFGSDTAYNYQDYKTVQGQKPAPAAEATIPPAEAAMYDEAKSLGDRAAGLAAHLKRLMKAHEGLSESNSRPIVIAQGSDASPWLGGRSMLEFNFRVDQLQASLFDPAKPKVIKEPVIGTLDPRKIEQTIAQSRFELQLCYELALRRNQAAGGTMEWQWHLDTQGRVSDMTLVGSQIADEKMIECVREKLSRWNWPKPQKGSIRISFPFYFHPTKG